MVERISVPKEIEDEFVAIARKWDDETCFMSNTQLVIENENYHTILDKARVKPAIYIPLILKYYSYGFTYIRQDYMDGVGHAWGWPYMLNVLLGGHPEFKQSGHLWSVVADYHEFAKAKGYAPAL